MIRKKLKMMTLCIILCTVIILSIQTTSMAATFSVSAGKTTLSVGETTSLNINGSGCLGKFTITSSDSSVVSVSESSKWMEDNNASITLTANKAGSATITVTATNVSDLSGDNEVTGSKSVKITVSAPEQKESTNSSSSSGDSSKSSDATLKAITIGGKTYNNPKTSITASSVSADTSTIKISATANDSKAVVSGTGTKELVTGTNKFTIKVTAENGTTKSYTIKVARLAEDNDNPNNTDETLVDDASKTPQDLRLTSLVIQDLELSPEFNSETFEYTVYITNDTEVKIDVTANMEDANIEITGNTELVDGENIATVKLTKDEQVVEYKIKINKATVMQEDETDDDDEQKVGFIGSIKNWWNGTRLLSCFDDSNINSFGGSYYICGCIL